MAFEFGLLGYSGGNVPAESLAELLRFLEGGNFGVTFTKFREMEGWAGATVVSSNADGSRYEQGVQVSVGGQIVDSYLDLARSTIPEEDLVGRDLMVTVLITGDMDEAANDRIIAYAEDRWRGIPWDEVSGFQTSFKRL